MVGLEGLEQRRAGPIFMLQSWSLKSSIAPLSSPQLEARTGSTLGLSASLDLSFPTIPPVKSCVLLHSAISGKPAGGGGTCCSKPFSIQGGSPPESRRARVCGSIGGALDVKTFHECGI